MNRLPLIASFFIWSALSPTQAMEMGHNANSNNSSDMTIAEHNTQPTLFNPTNTIYNLNQQTETQPTMTETMISEPFLQQTYPFSCCSTNTFYNFQHTTANSNNSSHMLRTEQNTWTILLIPTNTPAAPTHQTATPPIITLNVISEPILQQPYLYRTNTLYNLQHRVANNNIPRTDHNTQATFFIPTNTLPALTQQTATQPIMTPPVLEKNATIPQSTPQKKRRSSKKRSLICKYCFKYFTQRTNLNNHIRTHTGEKPFVCEYCSKGFAEKSNLTRHRRIHTGEKPFVCDYCNKGFAKKHNLTTHRRIHTGEKPFACTLCDHRFISKSGLNAHLKHRHKGLS